MKKILIFGPIGDFGGRELESGFIAKTLSNSYAVDICTTTSFTLKSQVFEFNVEQSMFSLNQLLYNQYLTFKFLSNLSYLKNRMEGERYDYANNYLLKHYFNYNKKINLIIDTLVSAYDAIFICAQLSSAYIHEVIMYARKYNIKIFFRTTGAISSSKYSFIQEVDCFIHHSFKNAGAIEKYFNHNFEVIDQFANDEKNLLEIPITSIKKNKYGFLGRFSPEKGLLNLMKYFINLNEILLIAGKGSQREKVISLVENYNVFEFLGEIKPENLHEFFKEIDVLIIPSLEEAGPIVAIESMAAGKIIFTTRVGAMTERLDENEYPFWFDINDMESLNSCFVRFLNMEISEVSILRNSLRKTYIDHFSQKKIASKYTNIVNKYLNE